MTAQELKSSILQMAIQGKLVKQDPNDEPASVLLEKIKKEREKLIKEKKIKRENYSEIYKDPSDNHYYEKFEDGTINDITDEIPFEIPDCWCWTRLYSMANIYTGNSISETEKAKKYTHLSEGHNFIATKDVSFENKIDYLNGIKIPFTEKQFKIAPAFSTLMCIEGGSVGRKVGYLNEDVCFGNKLVSINSYCTNKKYIYYLFQSQYIKDFIKENMTGIIGGISINKLKQFIVPIPSLNEQVRIISKIENILPKIDEYDKSYVKINSLNDSYKQELQKSILQYAIQGKLVKQDENDEPASKLVERILDEKRKMMKNKEIKKENLSIIYKDADNQFYEKFDDGKIVNITEEITIDIPQNWRWTRLKNIVYNHGQKKPETTFSYIDIGTLDNINHKLNEIENIIEAKQAPSRARKIVKKGDVIYSTVRPYLHNICIVDKVFSKEPIASTGFAVFSCITGIYNKYLFYLLLTPFFDSYANSNENAKGVAYPAINDEKLYKALIPIPPLKEQQNIVDKLEKIFNKIG